MKLGDDQLEAHLNDLVLRSAALLDAEGGAIGSVTACQTRLEVKEAYHSKSATDNAKSNTFSLDVNTREGSWKSVINQEQVWLSEIDDARFTEGFRSYHHHAGRTFFVHFPLLVHGSPLGFLGLAFQRSIRAKTAQLNAVQWMAKSAALLMVSNIPNRPQEADSAFSDDQFKRRAKHLIDVRIFDMRWEDLKSEALAWEMGYSTRHFHDLFLRSFGETPHKWILNCRLQQARELLLANHSISYVAYRYGFADHAHFANRFRERFGYAPSAAKHLKIIP
jgi:AraC-like DNA-binding protein/phosphotransferase system IIB component